MSDFGTHDSCFDEEYDCPECGGAICDCADRERRENEGTSLCQGLCDPMCDWCLVSHCCPDDCGGGERCPYKALARHRAPIAQGDANDPDN